MRCRVTLNLLPDSELAKQMESKEKERISNATASWTDSDRDALIKRTQELKERQERPDTPEALKVRS